MGVFVRIYWGPYEYVYGSIHFNVAIWLYLCDQMHDNVLENCVKTVFVFD